MANVINRKTKEYLKSINTPDYSENEWIINPILPDCDSSEWIIKKDSVRETTQEEKDAKEVAKIINEANTASTERQAVLRGRLYRQIQAMYSRLTEQEFRQLHFHLKDNTSFIRFHRLDKYGDSLTKARESVRLVNRSHDPVSGFEICIESVFI